MGERRKERRHVVSFAVALESQGRYVFSTRARDVASRGLLVMMAARLEVGEPVVITYSVEGGGGGCRDIEGRIVRVAQNEGLGRSEWPYLAAVELAEPFPELEEILGATDEEGEREA